MLVCTMALLDRLRARLRRPTPVADPSRTEMGTERLADGTVLERCVVVDGAGFQRALNATGRTRLVFHFQAADPASAHDLHELRELHLYYSAQFDLVSVAWDLALDASVPRAGAVVDAFHRDHGLTWQSLLVQGETPPATLPLLRLIDGQDQLRHERVGAWEWGDRPLIERLLTAH